MSLVIALVYISFNVEQKVAPSQLGSINSEEKETHLAIKAAETVNYTRLYLHISLTQSQDIAGIDS